MHAASEGQAAAVEFLLEAKSDIAGTDVSSAIIAFCFTLALRGYGHAGEERGNEEWAGAVQ
jgi:hypothetical protein